MAGPPDADDSRDLRPVGLAGIGLVEKRPHAPFDAVSSSSAQPASADRARSRSLSFAGPRPTSPESALWINSIDRNASAIAAGMLRKAAA